MMERINMFVCMMLFLSHLFAVIAVSTPNWIVVNIASRTTIGLTRSCVEFDEPRRECEKPVLPPEWTACLIFICLGIVSKILALFMSLWGPDIHKVDKWIAIYGMIMFCLVALLFPFGFHIPEIGGKAYKLPPRTEIGYSYYFFFAALFCSAVSCSLSNLHMIHIHMF